MTAFRDALAHQPDSVVGEVEAAVRRAIEAAHESGLTDGWDAYALAHSLPND
jgi:hypothetical protein